MHYGMTDFVIFCGTNLQVYELCEPAKFSTTPLEIIFLNWMLFCAESLLMSETPI